jgi:CheY-like chemotaxis protein
MMFKELVLTKNASALVVEDDALNLVAITNLLKELNIQYKRNTTGMDVLQQARAMQPLPDVILLDMDLPYSTPYTICTAIRSDSLLAHIRHGW